MKRLLSIWLPNWPIQRLRSEWLQDAPDNGDTSATDGPTETRGTLQQAASGSRGTSAPKPSTAPHRASSRATDFASAGHPLILWKNDPRRGRLVVACCAESRNLGVRCGIAIAQATELVFNAQRNEKQPLVLEHDPIADSVALERLTTALQHQISPLVAIESLGPRLWAGQSLAEPDTLFCDLDGITHLFGDEHGVLSATHHCLASFNLRGKLAIADNAAAAWAHAHYNPSQNLISDHLIADLSPLPVNALRLESETRYTLDRLGVETIDSLFRLPRAGLARRLGQGLVERIAEVRGELDVPLRFHHADPQYSAEHELEYATEDVEIVNHRLTHLADDLIAQLSRNQRGALRLGVRLDFQEHPPLRPIIGLFAPTLDREHLACLIHAGIESLRLPAPITRIRLQVLQSGPLRVQQNSLFPDQNIGLDSQAVADSSLAKLVDSLTSRLGRDAVLGVRLSDNPLPERAYRTYSLTDHRTRRAIRRLRSDPNRQVDGKTQSASPADDHADPVSGFRPPSRRDARRRPLKLLRKPIPLIPASTSQPPGHAAHQHANRHGPGADLLPTQPSAFRVGERVHHVDHFWGPERIETGWWDGPSVRRDYFRIETDAGYLWWIFRELPTGNWFLHGRFA